MSQTQSPEFYYPEDIQQILQLALAHQGDKEKLSREQLWEIAAELEIEPAAMELAEQQWRDQQAIAQKRQEFQQLRRSQFFNRGVRYLIINSFLLGINFLSAGTVSWALYIALLWGLGLSLDGWKSFQSQGTAYERDFQRWRLKNEVKESFSRLWNRLKNGL